MSFEHRDHSGQSSHNQPEHFGQHRKNYIPILRYRIKVRPDRTPASDSDLEPIAGSPSRRQTCANSPPTSMLVRARSCHVPTVTAMAVTGGGRHDAHDNVSHGEHARHRWRGGPRPARSNPLASTDSRTVPVRGRETGGRRRRRGGSTTWTAPAGGREKGQHDGHP